MQSHAITFFQHLGKILIMIASAGYAGTNVNGIFSRWYL